MDLAKTQCTRDDEDPYLCISIDQHKILISKFLSRRKFRRLIKLSYVLNLNYSQQALYLALGTSYGNKDVLTEGGARGCTPPSPGQMGCRGCAMIKHSIMHFMIKQKNMIQYLSIMFDIFITADCFSPLDV